MNTEYMKYHNHHITKYTLFAKVYHLNIKPIIISLTSLDAPKPTGSIIKSDTVSLNSIDAPEPTRST